MTIYTVTTYPYENDGSSVEYVFTDRQEADGFAAAIQAHPEYELLAGGPGREIEVIEWHTWAAADAIETLPFVEEEEEEEEE